MCTLHKDVFTFMVNYEKYYRQSFGENQNKKFRFKHFLLKSYLVRKTEKKYCTDREATDISIKRRMRIECWIRKAINKNTKFLIFIAFHYNNTSSYTECYIIVTVSLLLHINPVNKERIRIPPFPSTVTCNATASFQSNIITHISTYLSI